MSGTRNALAGGVFEPDPNNPLAGSYSAADAADFHRQNLADTWAAVRDPQTWTDAAQHYGQGLLMGSVAPEMNAAGLGRMFYHGMPGPMEGTALRASERGYFGPAVYLSGQREVAGTYGKNVVQASVDGDVFQAWHRKGTLEQDPGAHEKILAGLAPSERDAVRSLQGWYGKDSAAFYQALSRSASPASVQEALAKAGYAGIEGIGDGHEIAVFNPANVKVQTAADHPLATDAAPEMKGLGLDAQALKVLRANAD